MASFINHQNEMEINQTEALPPFQFQKRFGEINWRKLSAIDLDKIIRELDFATLQENISTVTFANVDAIGDVDPLIGKLLKLAQYTIEYMLHSQDYLQSIIQSLEDKISMDNKLQNEMKLKISNMQSETDKYKTESKKRKKIIQQQQLLIESGASSFYQCPHCEKAFMNASFLQGHMQRRHPDSAAYIGDVIKHAENAQQKLHAQIKVLENDLKNDRNIFEQKMTQAEKEKLKWEEKYREEMIAWKNEEEQKLLNQVEEVKRSFSTDIDKLKSKEIEYKQTIEALQNKLDKSQSNLGVLQDDYREEKLKIRNYGNRMQSLEEYNVDKDQAIQSLFKEIQKVKNDSEKKLMQHKKQNVFFMNNSVKKSASKKAKIVSPKILKRKSPNVIEADSEVPDYRSNYDEMIITYRPFILQLLDDRLNKCGVDPLVRGIAKTMLTNKLVVLKKERQQKSFNDPNYFQIRESIKQELEHKVSGRKSSFKKKKSKSDKKPKSSSNISNNDGASGNQLIYSTPISQNDKNLMKKELDISSPKLSSINKSPLNGKKSQKDRLGSIKDEESSFWDSDEDEVQEEDTFEPNKDKTVSYSDWDIDSVESLKISKRNEFPKTNVKKLAANLDEKLKHQKPPHKGIVGGVAVVQNPFDSSDNDDLFSISSEENIQNLPKPAPRNNPNNSPKVGTGSASGTSVWGSDHKQSTDNFSSTKKSDLEDLCLDDFSD